MEDFLGQRYDIGDQIYYVIVLWDKHLEAKLGKIVTINTNTITVKNNGGLFSVLRKPERHINLTKLQNLYLTK